MAFDPAPSSWVTGWSEDGSDVTFPIASISNLSPSLADASTGDWRLCIALLLEHTLNYYNSLDPADQPQQVTLGSTYFVNEDGEIYRTIQLTAKVSTLMVGSTFSPDSE